MLTHIQHREWYLLVFFLGLILCITALGGGLFGQSDIWFQNWQHKAFAGLCHQDPQRSFWISGTPMAVCTRCLGIYTGFTLMWMVLISLASITDLLKGKGKMVLFGVVCLNIGDIAGNSLGIWENTLTSRYLMGTLIGLTGAAVMACGFIGTQQQNINNYGTVRTNQ